MGTVIDYATGPPPAETIKHAGHEGAVRYISPPREKWMTGKPVHRPELDDFDAHGLKMAMVWQFGKDADADIKRGFEGGVADARAAQAQLDAIRASGHPVFFAVDYDIKLHEWNAYGVEYFKGAASVLGKQRVGIYGHARVCHWAGPEDDVVARVAPGRWFCWVTKAWSGEATGKDYAVLYQRIVDTPSNPGPVVGGVVVDVNDILFPEWGWRAFDEFQPDTTLPRFDEVLSLRPDRWTKGRNGKRIQYVTRHHMGGIGDGAKCVEWWQTRAASAHAAVDRHGKRSSIVHKDDTAFSNADWNSNLVSYSIEHSNDGGAAQDWPISDATIREGARLAAEICFAEGLGRPEFGKNIRDHREFGSTSCPYHLAKGGKYHDRWMREARSWYDTLVTPTIKESGGIQDMNINSLVAKAKSFPLSLAIGFIDRATFEIRALIIALYRELGLDPDKVIADAIAAENK